MSATSTRISALVMSIQRLNPNYEFDDRYIDSISLTIMENPVKAADGQLYDKTSIEDWFKQCKSDHKAIISPLTGEELKNENLAPDGEFKKEILNYLRTVEAKLNKASSSSSSALPSSSSMDLPLPKPNLITRPLNYKFVNALDLLPTIPSASSSSSALPSSSSSSFLHTLPPTFFYNDAIVIPKPPAVNVSLRGIKEEKLSFHFMGSECGVKLLLRLTLNQWTEDFVSTMGAPKGHVDIEMKKAPSHTLQLWEAFHGSRNQEWRPTASYHAAKLGCVIVVTLGEDSDFNAEITELRNHIESIRKYHPRESNCAIILVGLDDIKDPSFNRMPQIDRLKKEAQRCGIEKDILIVSARTAANCDTLMARIEEIVIRDYIQLKRNEVPKNVSTISVLCPRK